ncbi:MAG TPA: ABC transporter substrate-binding protein [Roseiflexaceae bacterium]|nr:ABC transporter substrate-binding protein [Roseiflexaceae bacterium]HMP40410.1 ABC transporter substrate-binding protein [Roseiflexaceae bacterium]
MRTASFRHGVFAFLSMLLLLAACGGATAPAAAPTSAPAVTAPETVKLRTGYIPILIYAPLFVGIERGYFANEGLEIELTALQSGNEAVVQLAADNFDVALGGVSAGLFNAAARGVKFTIVAPLHNEVPPVVTPLVISAKRTGEITSVADLKGKKVGVNAIGAGTEYWIYQALAQGGLTIDDVELVGMPFPNVPPALENGALDAAMLAEPIATINIDNGLVAVLSNDFIDGFTATYVYMGKLLDEQPDVARRFMRAYLRSTRDLQGEYMNDGTAAIIEKYTNVPAEVLKRLPRPRYDPNGTVPMQDLNAMQGYFLTRGVLEYTEPLDLNRFVNTQLAADAAADLNR